MLAGGPRPAHTTGLLLVNLGTPDDPSPPAVRRYLRQFLSDPRVVDIPDWRRWLVLNFLILPFRPKKSAAAYAKIWTERGSPLLFHGVDLTVKVRALLDGVAHVELAMRYGRPTIAHALDRFRERGVDRIVVLALYPQYSSASTGSTVEEVLRLAGKRWNTPFLHVVPPFFDHPAFLEASAQVARPVLAAERPERVLFSFHGLPERQIRKGDLAGEHCLARADCCDGATLANRSCYRAHCVATARALAERLGIPAERYVVCFQSRLGRTPWIRPYTDEVVVESARAGVKRMAILSPAFVADCLETLEELGLRAAESFRAEGGETLRLVPALNSSDAWAQAVVRIARESCGWLGASPSERHPRSSGPSG